MVTIDGYSCMRIVHDGIVMVNHGWWCFMNGYLSNRKKVKPHKTISQRIFFDNTSGFENGRAVQTIGRVSPYPSFLHSDFTLRGDETTIDTSA